MFNQFTRCSVAFILLAAAAISKGQEATNASPEPKPSILYTSTVITDGLSKPWSLAFLPNGSMLATERPGNLLMLSQDGKVKETISGLPPVYANSQGGLFDVVLHPDFENNGWIYLSLAHGDAEANATRVVRAQLVDNRLIDLEIIFTAQPYKDTPVHYGARMTFLPDNSLVLGVGDGFDYREKAQALDNHLGKFIRVMDDGAIPADNPFMNDPLALPEIYSLGHRNQQAILYDDTNKIIWAHEHGPAGGDEINTIRAGENYGWPVATRGRDYSGAAISPFKDVEGMKSPMWDWTPSIAPSGMTQLAGELFTEWKGDLLVTALKSRDVRRMKINGNTLYEEEILFTEFGSRLRDVRQGPYGAIYLLTDKAPNGELIRITPSSDSRP